MDGLPNNDIFVSYAVRSRYYVVRSLLVGFDGTSVESGGKTISAVGGRILMSPLPASDDITPAVSASELAAFMSVTGPTSGTGAYSSPNAICAAISFRLPIALSASAFNFSSPSSCSWRA